MQIKNLGIEIRIDEKDRIKIPASVRKNLNIKKGKNLFFQAYQEGINVFLKKPKGSFIVASVESQDRIILSRRTGIRFLFRKNVKISQIKEGFSIFPKR